MMARTDRHCRYFFRLLAPGAKLYTEMVTAQALLRGASDRLLAFDAAEHPLVLQLGGSEPGELAAAARVANRWHYDEINLNIGCPSDRVQTGRFGACLMAEPDRVADCVAAMRETAGVPVSVKTRIGIDDLDDYAFLATFVRTVAAAGCDCFIVHARKAILDGLSPKQNRAVPPLRYHVVYRLKQDFPDLTVILNGGIDHIDAVRHHLERVDGVMIGRKAYADPWFLAALQTELSPQRANRAAPAASREYVVRSMAAYARRQLADGARLHHITRHMLGLFAGQPGARRWRRYLTEKSVVACADESALIDSLEVFDVAA